MLVVITKDYEEMSLKASELVKEVLISKPNCVLGLATGTTPIGLYQNLIKAYKAGEISFKNVVSANLDEYVGLEKSHNQSYDYFMAHNLFDQVDMKKENINIPNGMAKNLDEECARYDNFLKENTQDLQILGIGSNGHIGFNEPGTDFNSNTHVVELSKSTIKDNSRLFEDISLVPTKAVTMGISQIMNAKEVIILASGKNKAQAVYNMVKAKPSTNCPASVLQNHPNCILIVDTDAASLL